MNKKGIVVSAGMIFLLAVVGIVAYLVMSGGGTSALSVKSDVPAMEVDLTSIKSGVVCYEPSQENHWECIITDADLNSANQTNITYTISTSVKDLRKNSLGQSEDLTLKYGCKADKFEDIDNADGTQEHPIQYGGLATGYSVSIDGTADACKTGSSEITKLGEDDSAAIIAEVEDYTTLDLGIENTGERMVILYHDVSLEGSQKGSVKLIYEQ